MGRVRCVDTEKPEFAILYGTVYKKLCQALAKVIPFLMMGTKWCTKCVWEVLTSWLAINGVIVNVEKIMSVLIVKTWNLKRCFCNFESIFREVLTIGFSVYNGSFGVIKNGKLKRCFCDFP
jgi:hypothetical protein